MDTVLPQKFPFILNRNLAKANCTENRVCTSCDIVVIEFSLYREQHAYIGYLKHSKKNQQFRHPFHSISKHSSYLISEHKNYFHQMAD